MRVENPSTRNDHRVMDGRRVRHPGDGLRGSSTAPMGRESLLREPEPLAQLQHMPLNPHHEFVAALERCERECPEETVALVEELIGYGDVARAASICSLGLGSLDVAELVETHALEFIDAGYSEVVEIVVLDSEGDIDPCVLRSVSFVLSALRNPRPNAVFNVRAETLWERVEGAPFGVSLDEQLDPLNEDAQAFLRLICLLTSPLRYRQCAQSALAPLASSRLCRHYSSLIDAILLCFENRHDEAILRLARFTRHPAADSVAGAVATVFGFVDILAAGSAVSEDLLEASAHAVEFLYRCRYDSLAAECEALMLSARALFDASTPANALRDVKGRMMRLCDSHLVSLFTLALAIAYLREHSYFAAYNAVSGQAKGCEAQGMHNLAWCFSIIEKLCVDLLDVQRPEPYVPMLTPAADLGVVPVRTLVESVSNELFDLEVAFDADYVRDIFAGYQASPLAIGLVRACVESGWTYAEKLVGHIPEPWCPRANDEEAMRPTLGEGDDEPAARGAIVEAKAAPRRIPGLSIHVLGEFEVYVGGRRIPEDQWHRRAAKGLLCALAIVPSHSLTRARLFEMLWPDRDYVSCRNNLYTVLSGVRKTIGCHGRSLPYLICEDGRITLNPKLVSCDIDVFDRLCKTLIAHEGSLEHRLAACRKIRDLFLTGLYVPNQDSVGDFATRKRNVEELYVDALVEGAELALALGYVKEALWFANDAYAHAPLREDCMVERLKALSSEGRTFELNQAFAVYCDELERELAMSPSERMQALFQELSENSERTERERRRFKGEGTVLPFRPLGNEGAS